MKPGVLPQDASRQGRTRSRQSGNEMETGILRQGKSPEILRIGAVVCDGSGDPTSIEPGVSVSAATQIQANLGDYSSFELSSLHQPIQKVSL